MLWSGKIHIMPPTTPSVGRAQSSHSFQAFCRSRRSWAEIQPGSICPVIPRCAPDARRLAAVTASGARRSRTVSPKQLDRSSGRSVGWQPLRSKHSGSSHLMTSFLVPMCLAWARKEWPQALQAPVQHIMSLFDWRLHMRTCKSVPQSTSN